MKGTIKLGDKVVCKDVSVQILEMPRSWSGSFNPDEDSTGNVREAFNSNQNCRLQLADGRSGDILLKKVSGLGTVHVEFLGSGPLA